MGEAGWPSLGGRHRQKESFLCLVCVRSDLEHNVLKYSNIQVIVTSS